MTANVVVISSFSDDIHALAVAERLRRLDEGARPVLFDTVTFPITSRLDWSLSTTCSTIDFAVGRPMPLGIAARPEADLGTLPPGEQARLSGDSIRSVWLRRPRRVSVPVEVRDSALRSYTHQTNRELLQGFIATTPAYNDPLAEGRASHRAYQLHTARQVGLTIPDTLITSDATTGRPGAVPRHVAAAREGWPRPPHRGHGFSGLRGRMAQGG